MKANLLLSVGVALTGISLPIAISYSLQGFVNASPLQAFAAGAALCSTSLGTTFTVLTSSGLTTTRLGVVLTSAAMMDDVVGLVMVQVISNLGGSDSSFSAVTIIRPLLVSVAFIAITPLACRCIVYPLTLGMNDYRQKHPQSLISRILLQQNTAWIIHMAILIGMVTGASYAGTSNLFAVYLSGAAISWWDADVPHIAKETISHELQTLDNISRSLSPTASLQSGQIQTPPESVDGEADQAPPPNPVTLASKNEVNVDDFTGVSTYHAYLHEPVERVLKPLFFVSIHLPRGRYIVNGSGFNRLLNTDLKDVYRRSHLAWCYIYSFDDISQVCLWCLAHSIIVSSIAPENYLDQERHIYKS